MEAPQLPDIEVVSAKVHEAWMESKRAQGLTTRQSESGEELMVPYEQLSEPAKELDRVTVRAVYDAIRAAAEEGTGDQETTVSA
jgi:hypothetical protein